MKNNQIFTKCGETTLIGGLDAAGINAVASKKYKSDPTID